VLTQQGEPESRSERLDTAAAPPAEASSVSGATPSVWKEESAVFMRRIVWLARDCRGIVGGEHQIVKAAQDEASPAALCRKTPEAQDLLLAEREGVLWRYLPEAHDAGSYHPCDGCSSCSRAQQKRQEGSQQQREAWVSLLRRTLKAALVLENANVKDWVYTDVLFIWAM